MSKGELTAYLNILQTVAKSNKLDTLKGIAYHDGCLEATNLDVFVRLKFATTAPEGIYDNQILNLLKVVPTMNIAPYQKQPISDFPTYQKVEGRDVDLPTEEVLKAMNFVSTDVMRPVLTCVWLDKNEIVATDGFRIYASGHLHPQYDGLQVSLRPELLKAWKKAAKYGGWVLTYDGDRVMLDNNTISLACNTASGTPPEIRQLADSNRTFTHKAILPYAQLKKLITKADKELVIGAGGELTLSGRPLPFKAELVEDPKEYECGEFRQVLCGLNKHNFALDGTLLIAYTCSNKGELVIRYDGTNFKNKVYSIE